MSIERIRFYDDDDTNIASVERAFPGVIKCIHVPAEPLEHCRPTDPGVEPHLTAPNGYYRYIEECGGWDLAGADNDLARLLIFFRSFNSFVEEHASQALTEAHIADIRAWADSLPEVSAGVRGKLFLDWDQVVSQLEGFLAPARLSDYRHASYAHFGVEMSAYAKLCLGTKARYDAMVNLFRHLLDHNMEVHIVTNNGTCVNSLGDFDIFRPIVASMDPRIQVSCCKEAPYGRNKGSCIRLRRLTTLAFGREVTSFGKFRAAYVKSKKSGGSRRAYLKFVHALNSLL
jgi:hypothetical protein